MRFIYLLFILLLFGNVFAFDASTLPFDEPTETPVSDVPTPEPVFDDLPFDDKAGNDIPEKKPITADLPFEDVSFEDVSIEIESEGEIVDDSALIEETTQKPQFHLSYYVSALIFIVLVSIVFYFAKKNKTVEGREF